MLEIPFVKIFYDSPLNKLKLTPQMIRSMHYLTLETTVSKGFFFVNFIENCYTYPKFKHKEWRSDLRAKKKYSFINTDTNIRF